MSVNVGCTAAPSVLLYCNRVWLSKNIWQIQYTSTWYLYSVMRKVVRYTCTCAGIKIWSYEKENLCTCTCMLVLLNEPCAGSFPPTALPTPIIKSYRNM